MYYSFKKIFILLFTLCLLVANIAAYVIYRQSVKMTDAQGWVNHTNKVMEETFSVFYSIQDSVTSQRGYILTNNAEFLANYEKSSSSIGARLRDLIELTADNPEQTRRLSELKDLISQQLEILDARIALKGPQSKEIDEASVTQSKAIMDKIRALRVEILNEERDLLTMRSEAQQDSQKAFSATLVITSGIAIGVLLFANGIILYVTGRQRRAEQSLAEAEKDLAEAVDRMELALQATSDGILDWKIDRKEWFFSKRFKEMLGYGPGELAGTPETFNRLLHPDDRDETWKIIESCRNGETERYSHTFRMQHKNGGWRWHLARGLGLYDAAKNAYRILSAHTDITDFKSLEENLVASNKELEEFTYIASHDLRSPLVNLKGFASELSMAVEALEPAVKAGLPALEPRAAQAAETALGKDIPLALQFIHSSVGRMDKLTNAILELSRIGRRELRFVRVNVQEIVDNCLNTLRHQLDSRGVTVEVGDLPDVTADQVALEQIFGNVIENAVKYLDPARPGHIAISGARYTSETVFRIVDNGRGIAPEDMKKIFEIFRRAGNNRDIPGEGMGMAYIKTMLRRHGGDIHCKSELGKGSTFYFSIAHQLEKGIRQNG